QALRYGPRAVRKSPSAFLQCAAGVREMCSDAEALAQRLSHCPVCEPAWCSGIYARELCDSGRDRGRSQGMRAAILLRRCAVLIALAAAARGGELESGRILRIVSDLKVHASDLRPGRTL